MRAMTIGISPEYNYPGTLEKWFENNTYYASNLGASMITRTIMKHFNADYIDDFSNISELKNKYDICYMSLAAHTSEIRDISFFTEIAEKLDMRIVILSLGMNDYLSNTSNYVFKIHKSLLRLLELASSSNEWIGVRGLNTASVLQQNGIKNVLPIGCPTVYMNQNKEFKLNIKDTYEKPALSYHYSIGDVNPLILDEIQSFIGQDYEDEIIFTNNLVNDLTLKKHMNNSYEKVKHKKELLELIKRKSIMPLKFDDWFGTFKEFDIIIGPRLHGCIAALNNGIPAIFTPRDIRVKEMVDFYNFPYIDYDKMTNLKLNEIYKIVNFDKFLETYPKRYKNYCAFLDENKLEYSFNFENKSEYNYLTQDIVGMNFLYNEQLRNLKETTINHKKRKIRKKLHSSKQILKKSIKKLIKK